MRFLSNSHRNFPRFRKYSLYFYSLLSFICSDLILGTKGDSGWLRVCDSDSNSKQYEIETDKCPHGAWLSDPMYSGCVCLNGLWAAGQNWCDENYRLLLGKGHCFQLDGNIQRLAYLGSPEDPFAPANFMTKRNGHVFKPFTDKISTPYEFELNFHNQNINKTILRLQPNSSKSFLIERTPRVVYANYDDSSPPLCLQSVDTKSLEETTLFVYKIKEAIKNLQLTDSCPAGAEIYSQKYYDNMSVLQIRPGETLHVKSGSITKSSEACIKTCKLGSEDPGAVIRHKRATKSKSTPKSKPKKGRRMSSKTNSEDSDTSSGSGDLANQGKMVDRQRLINEETARIIKAETMFLLEKKRVPRHNNSNWRLIQKAKQALAKACPEVEVPQFLLNAMLRVFRTIYMHSRDYNPYGHFFEENDQNTRIATSLDACIAEGEEIDFEYQPDKVKGANCTQREYELTGKSEKFCECHETLDMLKLNYTKNTSNPHEYFKLTRKQFELPTNYSYMLLPVTETFNGSNRDYPIETTWKIISFAHYYCAKFFKENPADHSALLIKMETFFNAEIIYRWNHPGLRTNETWQALYSTFNIQKFADSIDACVAAAKHVSEYPEWITRPTLDMIQRKKRSLDSKEVGSTKAYCLQDPWDPVDKLGVDVANECYEWNNL